MRGLAPKVRWWHPLIALSVYAVATALVAAAGIKSAPFVRLALAAMAVAAGCALAVALSRVTALDWLRALGTRTLGVYLLHFYVILGACLILAPVAGRVAAMPIVDLGLPLILTVAAVTISLGVHHLTRRITWLWSKPETARRWQRSAPRVAR